MPAGALLSVPNLTVAGYTSLPGVSMMGQLQLVCPDCSLRDDLCMLPGSLEVRVCHCLQAI